MMTKLKITRGPVKERLERLTIPWMLARSRQDFGPRVAMRFHDGSQFKAITYNEFWGMVSQAAASLRKAGVGRGDRVAILAENRPAWGAVYFATLFLEGINVPLDALLKPPDWSFILRDSEAKVLVTSAKFCPEVERFRREINSLKMIVSMDPRDCVPEYLFSDPNPSEISPPDTDIDEVAVILYTSGTTGLAKGVMLSHGNITSDIYAMTRMMELYPEDNFISMLPLHHTFECTCGFLTPLSQGASITYARGLASKLIVEDIRNNKSTVMLGVPLIYEKMFAGLMKAIAQKPVAVRGMVGVLSGLSKLLKRSANFEIGSKLFGGLRQRSGLSSLRLMITGGAAMSPEIAEAFNCLGFRLIQGYGLTEASPVLTLNPMAAYKNMSIGKALPGVQIRIGQMDEAGIGELVAKGAMVMKGYYRNPEATAQVLKDGWLFTGDIGYVDKSGFYYITGRKKNVIVTPGGKNLYPEEIEYALNRSPFILESLVTGQPVRDSGGGEEIKATIVPDLEYFGLVASQKRIRLTDDFVERTIKDEVAAQSEQLAVYKRVKRVVLRAEDFEKTSTRKIKRYLYIEKPVQVPTTSKEE